MQIRYFYACKLSSSSVSGQWSRGWVCSRSTWFGELDTVYDSYTDAEILQLKRIVVCVPEACLRSLAGLKLVLLSPFLFSKAH